MPFSLLGTCAPVAYTPHARVSAAQGNFSCHSSMFLVYSRCAFRRDSTVTDFALPWHHRQRGRGAAMTFEEMLDQAMAMLQRRRRVTYRALTLQFSLDDDHLEALKDEILYAHPHVVDDDGRGLIWTGEVRPTSTPGSPPAIDQARAPLSYTPSHLAEKILTSKSALEGERKQVTVLVADLKGSMELLAGRPAPAPGELPAGVSAFLGRPHLLHTAPVGPLDAGARRRAPGRAARARRRSRAAHARVDCADGGQSVLPGGERAGAR
jgi:hypothetical protein